MATTGERRTGARALTLTLLALALLPGAAAAELPPGHSGRWITDADGRVLILHGLNMVSKLPPYLPSHDGFSRDDARFLARNGFNTVRLGVIYKGLEPEPGKYDRGYLRDLVRTERMLAREGIYTLVDFHQDMYNERYSGEGWPDWAALDDGLPAAPDAGFPANYFAMPALNRAFDHFWANDPGPGGVGLQDRYAAAFRVVAKAFRDRSKVLGYDLMNEPWPGTIWPTCAHPFGCPGFDRGELTSFHRRVTQAIRKPDSRHLVWYEPEVIFNFGAVSNPDSPDPRAGISFHNYCLPDALGLLPPGNQLGATTCPLLEERVMDNAEKQARQTGDALMLSEFGATDDLALIRRIVRSAEEHVLSWQEWHYCDCSDATTSGPGTQSLVVDPRKPPRGANVKRAKLEILGRPYPQAVAGTPERFRFDPGTNRFDLAYRVRQPDGRKVGRGLTTDISVPRLHYPRGTYRVTAEGARVVSAARSRVLRLRACKGAEQVSAAVEPGRGRARAGCGR
jgi:endoglycosylceramidase